jgi:hypothetical protein
MILTQRELRKRAPVLVAGGQDLADGEARTVDRQVNQGSFRRVAVEPPEALDDLAQLMLLPLVQACRNFAMSSPRFLES